MLIIALFAMHALAGVFWAGSTFVLARGGADGAARLFRAQMGAAALTLLAGVGLWSILHRGPEGPMEKTLAVGAVCALVAAGLQGRLRKSSPVLAQRLAGGLLAITVVCMVTARYVG